MADRLNFLIAGAGAIGCLVGAKLCQAGQSVTFVARGATYEVLRQNGIRIDEAGVTQTLTSFQSASSVAQALAEQPGFDVIVVAVKSYDTLTLANELQAALQGKPAPTLLSVQNGVGNEQNLHAILPNAPILAGAISTPVAILGAGQIQVTKAGRVGLAAGPGVTDAHLTSSVVSSFDAAGLRTQEYADWQGLKWTKLLMNLLANASSAILDWLPAQVFAHPALADLEIRAWRETLAVMQRSDIRPVNFAGYNFPLFAPLVNTLPLTILRPVLRRLVSGARGSKPPSLNLDLHAAKGRSEVAWLNGAVLRKGVQVDVPTPVNQGLDELLNLIVKGKADWQSYRGQPEKLLAYIADVKA